VWWVLLVAHGWFLAARAEQRVADRRARVVGIAAAVATVLVAGLLRFDAAAIEEDLAQARADGDCAKAVRALDRVWFGHEVVAAPSVLRGEDTGRACDRLRTARELLTTALSGQVDPLDRGYRALDAVRAELPGHQRMAEVVEDAFLAGLPAKDPCRTVVLTDWLKQRVAGGKDRPAPTVAEVAPRALVDCGEGYLGKDWDKARAHLRQLLDQYPGHPLTPRAREGEHKAVLEIELRTVRGLVKGSSPAYCDKPAQYQAAPEPGGGTNRTLVIGDDEYTKRLPGEWKVDDAARAQLVLCAGKAEMGTPVRTCPYQGKGAFAKFPREVTFRKIAIPVKVFELRTGRLVKDQRVEIGGAVCPRVLHYTRYTNLVDIGPPGEVYVDAKDDDVRGAFQGLVTR
ncbi:tetratricopeptide repeat protein, partial [Crossiella equi]